MFENIDNIKLLDIHRGVSSRQMAYYDRFSHGFVFKLNGASIYDFGGRQLTLEAGMVLFIPKGASYHVRRITQGDSSYVLINFDADMLQATPKIWPLDRFPEAGLVRGELTNLWIFGGVAERHRCMGVFYNLLSYLMTLDRAQYAHTKQNRIIQPALDYLREHLFDTTLKIGYLPALCRISDTYFRRIFKANFAATPQEYVTNKRLEQAAVMLGSGEYASVSQVAQEVGYSDALYFSRIFAQRYGVCPTGYEIQLQQYRREISETD